MSEMSIALALGGGGVKGISHIGILRALERNGFCIKGIGGASIGALVGVFHGLGISADEMEKIFQRLKRTRYSGHDRNSEPSFLGNRGLSDCLRETIGKRTFNDLRVPLVVTATEIKHGREIFIQEGSLVDAVLASMALPGIFPAGQIDDMELTDGGTLTPVPVTAARSLVDSQTPVVAVVLTAPLGVPATMERITLPRFVPRWLAGRIKQMRLIRALDVFLLSQDMLNRAITKYNLDVSRPDLIIRPDVAHLYTLDKGYVTEIALKGDQAVRERLPDLMKLFSALPETDYPNEPRPA